MSFVPAVSAYDMRALVRQLRTIHEANRIKFKQKHGREAEVADQLKKHAEEVGEFIKAIDGKNDEPVLNELWDCIFSMIAAVLNPYQDFTDDEIAKAFVITLEKIDYRAKMILREQKAK